MSAVDFEVGVLFCNNQELVRPFLYFLRKSTVLRFRIIAIDQSSRDSTSDELVKNLHPEDLCLRLPMNRGVAGGRNVILRNRTPNLPLLLMDSDVFPIQRDSAAAMLQSIQPTGPCGVVFGEMANFWKPGDTTTGFAFAMFSPQAIEVLGEFDERFQMFFDDTAKMDLIHDLGIRYTHCPGARAVHLWGETVRQGSEEWRCERVFKEDRLLYRQMKGNP